MHRDISVYSSSTIKSFYACYLKIQIFFGVLVKQICMYFVEFHNLIPNLIQFTVNRQLSDNKASTLRDHIFAQNEQDIKKLRNVYTCMFESQNLHYMN